MEIKNWLKERWRRDNHAKYQKYFDLWWSNILPSQVEGFSKQLQNINDHIYA